MNDNDINPQMTQINADKTAVSFFIEMKTSVLICDICGLSFSEGGRD
jgi:hypothetical protein